MGQTVVNLATGCSTQALRMDASMVPGVARPALLIFTTAGQSASPAFFENCARPAARAPLAPPTSPAYVDPQPPWPMRPLTLHRKPLLCCALAVAVMAGVAFAVWPTEPRYEGKPLSYWLDYLPVTSVSPNNHPHVATPIHPVSTGGGAFPTTAEAGRAIVEVGSRGLPFLLQRLRTRERRRTPLEETWHEWFIWLHLARPALPLSLEAHIKRGQAVTALIQLGDITKPVLPQIVALAKSEPDPNVRASALEVLRHLSPADCAQVVGQTNVVSSAAH